MSQGCHKGFDLILKLPFKLRFKTNSPVFPKQPCSQWNDWGVPGCPIQLLLVGKVFSDFQNHLHGLLKTWVKHLARQHEMYSKN